MSQLSWGAAFEGLTISATSRVRRSPSGRARQGSFRVSPSACLATHVLHVRLNRCSRLLPKAGCDGKYHASTTFPRRSELPCGRERLGSSGRTIAASASALDCAPLPNVVELVLLALSRRHSHPHTVLHWSTRHCAHWSSPEEYLV
eukprot:scaffold23491_cov66-Phaeocystis_antarctica.AAC.4